MHSVNYGLSVIYIDGYITFGYVSVLKSISTYLYFMSSPLFSEYASIRDRTLTLVNCLNDEDCCVQSMPETSPIKWHLGHVSWFFENFILRHYESPFKPFHPFYLTMFSSYNRSGQTHPDPRRGLFTRPSLSTVREYGANVSDRLKRLLGEHEEDEMLHMLAVLGMHHERQHQELMLVDIKHLFSCNPLSPAYRSAKLPPAGEISPLEWHPYSGGLVEIGYQGKGFSYDNESPRHKCYLEPYQLASRLITNGEYLKFMEAGGYDRPELWLTEGWDWKITVPSHPLYWRSNNGSDWQEFTLNGAIPLDPNLPVIHVSYYEAHAFARWVDARLPTEVEWENVASQQEIRGSFADNNRFHPDPAQVEVASAGQLSQLYGDAWEWTTSSYGAYTGYNPAKPNPDEPMSMVWEEAVGEYNSRSMVNQNVLRGGSCVTSQEWIRSSFRNFFPARTCRQFTGIRLARDAS